jgi:hypothetical protein
MLLSPFAVDKLARNINEKELDMKSTRTVRTAHRNLKRAENALINALVKRFPEGSKVVAQPNRNHKPKVFEVLRHCRYSPGEMHIRNLETDATWDVNVPYLLSMGRLRDES